MSQPLTSIQQAVTFRTGEEWFGLPVMHVREIILPKLIQPISTHVETDNPSSVVGVIHLRGKVIPIHSFRRLLRKTEEEMHKKNRIIIVSNEETMIGLLVDEVFQVMNLKDMTWDTPPKGVTNYLFAVCKQPNHNELIYMVEAEKLLQLEGSDQP